MDRQARQMVWASVFGATFSKLRVGDWKAVKDIVEQSAQEADTAVRFLEQRVAAGANNVAVIVEEPTISEAERAEIVRQALTQTRGL